jgi:hypothetical protein
MAPLRPPLKKATSMPERCSIRIARPSRTLKRFTTPPLSS